MITKSLLLDVGTWDLTLDGKGDIASTQNPYAVAQDVATACSTFLGECWYDTTLGLPYYERILGHWPGTQLVNSKLQAEALKLPYVQAAISTISIGQGTRKTSGVMVITDTNSVQSTINL